MALRRETTSQWSVSGLEEHTALIANNLPSLGIILGWIVRSMPSAPSQSGQLRGLSPGVRRAVGWAEKGSMNEKHRLTALLLVYA